MNNTRKTKNLLVILHFLRNGLNSFLFFVTIVRQLRTFFMHTKIQNYILLSRIFRYILSDIQTKKDNFISVKFNRNSWLFVTLKI